MITIEQAVSAQVFYHTWKKDSRGEPVKVRRNGATQLWKTRPTEFRIPVKYGIMSRGQFQIWHTDAGEWNG